MGISPLETTELACSTTQPYVSTLQAERLASQFKAISHPVRLQIVEIINQAGGEACGCDIERYFALTQPTISHHLKLLREAEIIHSEARGVWVYHRVNTATLEMLKQVLSNLAIPTNMG